MSSIGDRLREERERLGLSQPELGAIGGVKKLAQINYEKGERFPGADYLAAMAAAGGDVLYVLTGKRLGAAAPALLARDEQQLLELYHAASLQLKMKAVSILSGDDLETAEKGVNVRGSGNRTSGRDYREG